MWTRTILARVPVAFTVDATAPPPERPIHAALRSLRGFEVEAPTLELAELHAQLLMEALERAGN